MSNPSTPSIYLAIFRPPRKLHNTEKEKSNTVWVSIEFLFRAAAAGLICLLWVTAYTLLFFSVLERGALLPPGPFHQSLVKSIKAIPSLTSQIEMISLSEAVALDISFGFHSGVGCSHSTSYRQTTQHPPGYSGPHRLFECWKIKDQLNR